MHAIITLNLCAGENAWPYPTSLCTSTDEARKEGSLDLSIFPNPDPHTMNTGNTSEQTKSYLLPVTQVRAQLVMCVTPPNSTARLAMVFWMPRL
jgi:hypothetical protein